MWTRLFLYQKNTTHAVLSLVEYLNVSASLICSHADFTSLMERPISLSVNLVWWVLPAGGIMLRLLQVHELKHVSGSDRSNTLSQNNGLFHLSEISLVSRLSIWVGCSYTMYCTTTNSCQNIWKSCFMILPPCFSYIQKWRATNGYCHTRRPESNTMQ